MTDRAPCVVWDIDDVLANASLTFYESVINTHGSCIHPDEWTEYKWGQYINMNEGNETQEYLIKYQIIENTKPFHYTVDALSLTQNNGLKNVLLSARAWHPNPQGATLSWLDSHNLGSLVNDMYFVNTHETKEASLKTLSETYEIRAFVEDNPHNALSSISIVPDVFLVKKPWNVNHWDNRDLRCVTTSLRAAEIITNQQVL